tara:strand:- start:2297 stop:5050 length:2754 start_codon:yes stop_codon:yes gene_type:complete
MSTQLILYPQTYDGTYNSVSTSSLTEYLVNGINFTSLNTTPDYATASNTPMQAAISSTPSLVLGNWYRYHTTGGGIWGATVAPVVASGLVDFSAGVSLGHNGMYQRLSGLAVGGQYDVVINISTPAVGDVTITIFNGTIQTQTASISANLNTITYTFTSPSTSPTFLIDFSGKASDLEVDNISIKQSAHVVSGVHSELSDGQVICDLYAEEEIPLTLSVDDFKNVAEKVQSYSKDFNLPATKRNNQIFNNMFEVTRSYDDLIFNPYIKTQCVLKQDGFILFEGYLRMITVIEQNGEISYNVNLYSDVIALADILKDKTFAELDFSELAHAYNYTNIRASWQGALVLTNPLPVGTFAGVAGASTTGVLKYPFIDWTHQIALDPTSGFPILPSLETAFRPCIKLKYLINRIFEAAGFGWTSNFFDSADFDKLYMDFNWGSENSPVDILDTTFETFYSYLVGDGSAANYAGTSFSVMNLSYNIPFFGGATPPHYDDVTNILTTLVANESYTVNYSYTIENTDVVAREIECRWLYNATPIDNTPAIGSASVISIPAGSDYTYTGVFTQIMLLAGDTLQVQFRTNSGTASQVRQSQIAFPFSGAGAEVTWSAGVEAITSATMLQTLRGELGQWDFLKGIMTMFNLVSMVDETDPENILIEPYGDVFVTNPNIKILDWTDKIDVSKMDLTPLTNLNKNTIFKFVEDEDDHVFRQYKHATSGHLYGSLKWEAQEGFTILEGEKEIIAEPFAATVSKPLEDNFSDFIVPSLYAMSDDGVEEGFDNSPRIFYTNGVKTLTSCTYSVPTQNGVAGDSFEDEFLQFSHLTDIPTVGGTRDFVFTSEQLFSPIGGSPVDNLFNVYWLPYFNELYNPDTRTMTLKVDLNPSDINSFMFYDKVQIKNRTFRVNKIEYKPNTLATVEFILIP